MSANQLFSSKHPSVENSHSILRNSLVFLQIMYFSIPTIVEVNNKQVNAGLLYHCIQNSVVVTLLIDNQLMLTLAITTTTADVLEAAIQI